MRIGLLEKKLEGGGQIDPPPLPCDRWENSPPEEGLKRGHFELRNVSYSQLLKFDSQNMSRWHAWDTVTV